MTDTETTAVEVWDTSHSLAPSDLESLQAKIDSLTPEEATTFCGNLQQRRRDQALVQGLVLYNMRTSSSGGSSAQRRPNRPSTTWSRVERPARQLPEPARRLAVDQRALQEQDPAGVGRVQGDPRRLGLRLDGRREVFFHCQLLGSSGTQRSTDLDVISPSSVTMSTQPLNAPVSPDPGASQR